MKSEHDQDGSERNVAQAVDERFGSLAEAVAERAGVGSHEAAAVLKELGLHHALRVSAEAVAPSLHSEIGPDALGVRVRFAAGMVAE